MKSSFCILFVLFTHLTFAQAPVNLGRIINSPLLTEEHPNITGNGKTLIFEANSGEDEAKEFLISTLNNGIWTAPTAVPGINSAL
ncbi:MAG TPA: hypothetical protein VNW99_02270, partial [Cytophagaceae bacterium]|nr:hypothetical protein [Cytophagaceae bacterium]